MKKNPLGNKTVYKDKYDPSLLFAIPRDIQRKKNNITINFKGFDVWNCYEFSYLDLNGKPETRILKIIYYSDSQYIVESKSLKLYLNSFVMSKFKNGNEVLKTIHNDLKKILIAGDLKISFLNFNSKFNYSEINEKFLIDNKKIKIDKYNYDYSLLKSIKLKDKKTFTKISNLLKTNCPITGQPDWATIYIKYKSINMIADDSLLKFIISFRNQADYHENACELIFNDIFKITKPDYLIVKCFYTRRGGIDINPVRYFNAKNIKINEHFWRQ